jgi:hypothetical protein
MKYTALLLAFLLAGCEYTYRYECQNPDNQGLPQCQPEVCGPLKTCYNDLAGIESQQDFQSEDTCSNSNVDSNFE